MTRNEGFGNNAGKKWTENEVGNMRKTSKIEGKKGEKIDQISIASRSKRLIIAGQKDAYLHGQNDTEIMVPRESLSQ